MRLTFLGTGSAFTERDDNFQSNMFVEETGAGEGTRKGLLIDAGTDVRWAMKALGMNHTNIDSVYISHVHADHIGGMEWLGFRTYFDPKAPRPTLIFTPDVRKDIWDNCLKGGMSGLGFGEADLETYFDVEIVQEERPFSWGRATFTPHRMPHFTTGLGEWPSFGLMIRTDSKSVFLTTDTSYAYDRVPHLYQEADIVLQDAETLPFRSGAHANYMDLRDLPADVKGKMWLYHYNDGELPDAEADGFLGFATRGQVIDLL